MLRAGKVSVALMSMASDRGTDGGSTQQGLSVAQEPPNTAVTDNQEKVFK